MMMMLMLMARSNDNVAAVVVARNWMVLMMRVLSNNVGIGGTRIDSSGSGWCRAVGISKERRDDVGEIQRRLLILRRRSGISRIVVIDVVISSASWMIVWLAHGNSLIGEGGCSWKRGEGNGIISICQKIAHARKRRRFDGKIRARRE